MSFISTWFTTSPHNAILFCLNSYILRKLLDKWVFSIYLWICNFWDFVILQFKSSCNIFLQHKEHSLACLFVYKCWSAGEIFFQLSFMKMSSYRPQFLKEIFASYRILDWHFFPQHFKYVIALISSLHCFWWQCRPLFISLFPCIQCFSFFLLSLFKIFTFSLMFFSLTMILFFF